MIREMHAHFLVKAVPSLFARRSIYYDLLGRLLEAFPGYISAVEVGTRTCGVIGKSLLLTIILTVGDYRVLNEHLSSLVTFTAIIPHDRPCHLGQIAMKLRTSIYYNTYKRCILTSFHNAIAI